MLWFEAKKGGNWESSTRLDQVWPLSLFLEFLEPLNSSIESFTSWNIAKCIKVKKQISRDGKGSEKTKSHYQLKKSLELVLSIDFRPMLGRRPKLVLSIDFRPMLGRRPKLVLSIDFRPMLGRCPDIVWLLKLRTFWRWTEKLRRI